MEYGNLPSYCDGLVAPKRLQDSSLEYFASLIYDAVHTNPVPGSTTVAQSTSRDQLSLYRSVERTWIWDHFHKSDEEEITGALRHLRASLGMEQVLGSHAVLPAHFCDRILAHASYKGRLTDSLVRCVGHMTFGSVTKLPTCKTLMLTQNTLEALVQQPLVELSIDFRTTHLSPVYPHNTSQDLSHIFTNSSAVNTLRSVSIHHSTFDMNIEWLGFFQNLIRLQFDGCNFRTDSLKAVEKLPSLSILSITNSNFVTLPRGSTSLQRLTLTNAPISTSETVLTDILSLRKLVYLDVAKITGDDSNSSSSLLKNADWMKRLSQMPNLKYLDVSRRLVSVGDTVHFDPPHHRMVFLGLLSTQACMRKDINSEMVAGDADEKQLLTSLQTYCERGLLLKHALYKLYEELEAKRINTSNDDLIQAILTIMERRERDSSFSICTSASACLFHFLHNTSIEDNTPVEERLSNFTCRRIVAVLMKSLEHLTMMYENSEENQIADYRDQAILNMMECLCCFQYPDSAIFVYSRMAKLLVHLAKCSEEKVKERAITILNSFVWQVSLEMKQMMKTYNGIEPVVDFITHKTQVEECDFYLECAWTFLWNVTDETTINCEELLDCGGLEALIDCYEVLKDKEESVNVLRSMLGALGNVAEVVSLRPRLLNREILLIFLTVLQSIKDLEVQYNICGIIVNLAMEDESLWLTIDKPSKDHLLDIVVSCVQQWDLTEQREIQYRSLRPIIRTVDYHDDRVTLWGVWALANLCQISASRYVPMFQSEGGPEAVRDLRRRTKLPLVSELATKVLSISEQNKKARTELYHTNI